MRGARRLHESGLRIVGPHHLVALLPEVEYPARQAAAGVEDGPVFRQLREEYGQRGLELAELDLVIDRIVTPEYLAGLDADIDRIVSEAHVVRCPDRTVPIV